jgi:hypothetical protein
MVSINLHKANANIIERNKMIGRFRGLHGFGQMAINGFYRLVLCVDMTETAVRERERERRREGG